MAKLNYQDEVKYVTEGVELIDKGGVLEEYEKHLEEQGLKKWEITKIVQSIHRKLRDQFKPKIRQYIIDGTLGDNLDEFDGIDADSFEKLQYEIISELKSESRKKIRTLITEGKSEEEILSEVPNHFFDEEEVLEYFEKEFIEKQEEKKQKDKGIGFIILGVLLSIGSLLFDQGVMVVFSGLIVYGIVVLTK